MATKVGDNPLQAALRALRPQVRELTRKGPKPAPPGAPSDAYPPPAAEADDGAAFRAAVAGTAPLPAGNRVQLAKAPSRRLPPRPARLNGEAAPVVRAETGGDLPAHWHTEGDAARRPLPPHPDAAAFVLAMRGVAPLPDSNRVVLGKPLPAARPQQFIADERAALHESLHGRIGLQDRLEGGDEPQHLRPGLAVNVLRDLRRGRWVIQGEIDLHGLNRDEARHALAAFLAECLHAGRRCVRVIHGKGLGSPQKQSVLRQLVRGWLAQRIEVLAYCQAKPQDGGEGALLVLLRSPKRNGAA